MADSVKGIFKTLIKIPVIVLVCFAIFNVFAFGLSYFKMLGLSYVAMQTAIENNYIPEEDRQTIENYMRTMETAVLADIKFTDNTSFTRRQYGQTVEVGVEAEYKFIWPLTYREQTSSGEGVEGMSNSLVAEEGEGNVSPSGIKSNEELQNTREAKMESADSDITIEYKVPGLKYYPDLE